MSIWDRIKSVFVQDGKKLVALELEPSQTDDASPDVALSAEQGYLSVTVVEMFLDKSRNWFTDRFPAVHALATLKYADKVRNFAQVAAPSQAAYQSKNAVLRNYPLLPPTPYRGGSVEIEAALIALPGTDVLASAISVLSDFSSLVGPPLSTAIGIADKIKEGADKLFPAGGIELCWHGAYLDDSNEHKIHPRYVAIIKATRDEVATADLRVVKDQLCIAQNGEVVPYTGRDHMLLRIGVTTERSDYRSYTDIETNWAQSRDAYLAGDNVKGDALKAIALSIVLKHQELTFPDRRRVAQAIREDLDLYATPAAQAAQAANKARPERLHHLITALPIDLTSIAEPTLDEFLS
jgi:hypothetical protein